MRKVLSVVSGSAFALALVAIAPKFLGSSGQPAGTLIGMAIIPLLFLMGAVHFWKKPSEG